MGCDYFADEDGEFKMSFETPSGELATVRMSGLEPGEKIYTDLLLGRPR